MRQYRQLTVVDFLSATDDVSREEMEEMRQEAAKSMKMTGHVHPKLLNEGNERTATLSTQQHQNRFDGHIWFPAQCGDNAVFDKCLCLQGQDRDPQQSADEVELANHYS